MADITFALKNILAASLKRVVVEAEHCTIRRPVHPTKFAEQHALRQRCVVRAEQALLGPLYPYEVALAASQFERRANPH